MFCWTDLMPITSHIWAMAAVTSGYAKPVMGGYDYFEAIRIAGFRQKFLGFVWVKLPLPIFRGKLVQMVAIGW